MQSAGNPKHTQSWWGHIIFAHPPDMYMSIYVCISYMCMSMCICIAIHIMALWLCFGACMNLLTCFMCARLSKSQPHFPATRRLWYVVLFWLEMGGVAWLIRAQCRVMPADLQTLCTERAHLRSLHALFWDQRRASLSSSSPRRPPPKVFFTSLDPSARLSSALGLCVCVCCKPLHQPWRRNGPRRFIAAGSLALFGVFSYGRSLLQVSSHSVRV